MRKTLLCLATMAGLAVAATPCSAVVFLSEGFEYADDAALTAAGWSIVEDPGTEPAMVEEGGQWTLYTPDHLRHANYSPPGVDGSPTNGGTKFICSNSARGSHSGTLLIPPDTGMSHDIYTPTFTTTGSSEVWLHADIAAMLNQGGKACFFIDVSTDGGANWNTAFERVDPGRGESGHFRYLPPSTTFNPTSDNADGYFGRLDLDLSPWAADAANVKVRFRHYEPYDDWYIRMDNVLINDVSAVQHGNTTIFAEYFDNPNPITTELRNPPDEPAYEWVGGMKKAGWHEAFPDYASTFWVTWHCTGPRTYDEFGQYGNEVRGQNRWVNRLEHSYHPDDGDPAGFNPNPDYAFIDCTYLNGSGNIAEEYMMTPVLDLSEVTNVVLGYQDEIWWYTENGICKAEVLLMCDTDGDGQEPDLHYEGYVTDDVTVKTIFSYDQNAIGGEDGEEPWYADRIFSVPEADGKTNYYFAWHFAGTNMPWWAIDSIKVSGTSNSVPPHMGDANGDGKVDNADAAILASHWHVQSGAAWADGDFNSDGKVDDKDASILAVNWHWGMSEEGDATVPEPSTLVLVLSAAAAAWFGYRRHR